MAPRDRTDEGLESSRHAWDVFVSYASEDRHAVAIPLVTRLRAAGLRSWIDVEAVRAGDNLRGRVNEAIAQSRFGVVILSKAFLDKKWTMDELDALLAMERHDHKVVVPVLHDLPDSQLSQRYPLLANRVFLNTTAGVDAVAEAIVRVVLLEALHGRSAVPTQRRRLLNLLDDPETTPASVRTFLQHHADIVVRAVGADSDPVIIWEPAFDTFVPDVSVSNFLPTAGRRSWHIAVLGPLGPVLFLNDTQPVAAIDDAIRGLDALRVWMTRRLAEARVILNGVTPDFSGIVVAGRRAQLSQKEGERLSACNDTLFGSRIRTYDWLVSAAEE
jgi:hypothetical protein